MKKLTFLILLLPVSCLLLLGPDIIDALHLRLFASPEYILNRFYTERDLAEDQLVDSLLLGGAKMTPSLEREILKKEIPRRLYAIYALGILGNIHSLPALEYIFQDKSENTYFRVAALRAMARIDLTYAQKIAAQYLDADAGGNLEKYAREVLTYSTKPDNRSYSDAFFHRHY